MPRKKNELNPKGHSQRPFTKNFNKVYADAHCPYQQTVADAIGVTRQAVGYYLKGSAQPDIVTLEKIADYFEVSTDYLLGRTDVQSPDENINSVCRYTGLSERAVKKFCEATAVNRAFDDLLSEDLETRLSFVSALLETDSFYSLLDDCAQYMTLRKDASRCGVKPLTKRNEQKLQKSISQLESEIREKTEGRFCVTSITDCIEGYHGKTMRKFEETIEEAYRIVDKEVSTDAE